MGQYMGGGGMVKMLEIKKINAWLTYKRMNYFQKVPK